MTSLSLFPDAVPGPADLPAGLRYRADAVSPGQQASLIEAFVSLDFQPFEFHGFTGLRETVSFGSRYDFAAARVRPAPPLPAFLAPLIAIAVEIADAPPQAFAQALVTRYAPGAGIGWHRDRPHYDRVVGFSFGAACDLRFRRREGKGWRRARLPLTPGSAYLLDGEAREAWEHSIAPHIGLRYSVTLRTLRSS